MIRQAAQTMLAAPFLFSGVAKALALVKAAGEFAALGLPAPSFILTVVVLFQLGAGILLTLGLFVTPAAFALAAFTAAATLLGHRFWMLEGNAAIHEATTALEHLAIIGGLLAIIALQQGKRA